MRRPLVLYLLALAVRLLLAAGFPDPAYPDSFYYVDVARQLAGGHGFSIDFIWIFAEVGGKLPASAVLPIASNAHWMPLASLVQVPFIWLLGPNALASALPFVLCGALMAPIAWGIAREAGVSDRVAIGAGILAAIPALATPYMAQPDNFGLFAPLVAGALWMTTRGLRGHARAYALAGLLVGLATLARNDGVLVGAVVGLVFLRDRWLAFRSHGSRTPVIPVWAAVACAGLFALVVAPWLLRQLAVFGTFSPSTASGKVLFIRDIGEWNSIDTPATLEHFLGQGIGPLVASRISGLLSAITIFSILVGGIVLVPFMLIGAWTRRRTADFGPFLVYFVVLFAFSSIVSAVHVPGGTFIHSAIALAPHAYVLALEGIGVAMAAMGRKRGWDAASASRVFTVALVGFCILGGAAAGYGSTSAWQAYAGTFKSVGRALDAAGAPPSDRVMSIDAAGTSYWTGHGGVVLVNDPLSTVEKVARAYDIRWLVIRRADSVASVGPILDGTGPRPDWLGAPIVLQGPADRPELSLLPVCTATGDPRCAP